MKIFRKSYKEPVFFGNPTPSLQHGYNEPIHAKREQTITIFCLDALNTKAFGNMWDQITLGLSNM